MAHDGAGPAQDEITPQENARSHTTERDREDRNGDISELFVMHGRGLVAALRKTFGNGPPDPEDVAHDAFTKLMERPDRKDIRNPKAFLWRVARNTFLNALNREGMRSRIDFEMAELFFPLQGAETTPETVLAVKDELKAINAALREMPEKRRHAFLLHKVENLPVTEVARRLGVARSPARKHIARAAHDIEVHLAKVQRGRR